MRLQRNLFETMFLGLPEDQREKSRYNEHMIRASYHDLTGGALRCNILGGNDQNVTRFFQTILARKDDKLEKLGAIGRGVVHALLGRGGARVG